MYFLHVLCSLLSGLLAVRASLDLTFGDDSDLTSFITRPEIRVPLFNVTKYNPSRLSPGYWFVAPYAFLLEDAHARNYYQPCQTGPAIYDDDGNLVWSGACLFNNQNTMDFRLAEYQDSQRLSVVLFSAWNKSRSGGILMDNSYSITDRLPAPKTSIRFDMHEFRLLKGSTKALRILHKPEYVDVSSLGVGIDAGWVNSFGFQEIDIVTHEVSFEWWTTDHVSLLESSVRIEGLEGPPPVTWSFFHMNSVDKNPEGDYMISSRFTDTIYKISGKDGSVIWRLGGSKSSFELQGFNFSKQHDARFISENETTTVISFLDNAADPFSQTSSYSSALLVTLETSTTPMTARVIQCWIRPDRKVSRLRGNFQLMSNNNAFVGWSDNAYITEHTAEGELLMEAQFKSDRFVTYRAHKAPFVGKPSESPVLKSFAYGSSPESCVQVSYVSWNGATEVARWEFYSTSITGLARGDDSMEKTSLMGTAVRSGFETSLHSPGYADAVYAVALNVHGQVLGRSEVALTVKPGHWQAAVTREEVSLAKKMPLISAYEASNTLSFTRTEL